MLVQLFHYLQSTFLSHITKVGSLLKLNWFSNSTFSECLENWYQRNPEDIKRLIQRLSLSPSNQELVCFLQYKSSNEIVDLIFMLGPETLHAVAKNILQSMPYEEAVTLLGSIRHHREGHHLHPLTSMTHRAHLHGHREPKKLNGIHFRKHIHY